METIFAIGSNGSGQLGIGHREDVSVPKPALFGVSNDDDGGVGVEPAQLPSPIVGFAAGGNHSLLLTREQGRPTTTPGRLVAALWEASVVVGADEQGRQNKVYSFGCGGKGELGQGPLIVRVPAPDLLPNFPPAGTEVVDLAACMGHAVAVLDNGEAWGWGQGRKGQLGLPEGIVTEPRKIEGLSFRVVKAACGKDFTVLVGEKSTGEILFLGSDKWGLKASTPSSVKDWRDVQASWGGVYVLRADGSILGWGRNDHGQLPPPGLPPISRMAAGSEHVVGITEAQDAVLAWGWGEHGNCGPQVQKPASTEQWNVIASSKYIPPGSRITEIAAGCATSWVIIGQSTP
ncbi:alpha-tubulin suppressor protein Aats1 [Magnaporthiopsis poae ATCC 64411]|uniref:Alpha-tubulin suppressor protein Aats1 n=1 Tax=Magnaporthiopsis poae (strain ATCC 64411 / 73-15) TaxID=644358 RepID=A0A0C4E6H0_MAGP6|nr:alpha-tubulin suppressor protein Aats1 [Magnaporthiopsis poae ATCC 64411]